MRLVEAIISANHAAVAGLRGEAKFDCFQQCLPLAALTCIDPRLNKLFPGALGLTEEQFIWLRNAGNVITSPTSSTVRSIALASYVKGAKEIAVIGHTNCKMSKLGAADLLERLKQAGIDRSALTIPNLHEFFGLFSSEKPNIIKAVGYLRTSPIIPPKMPIHGLLIDTATGRLEWVINGYESAGLPADAGITLEKLVSEALPVNLPGYVTGPVKSFAENIEPLVAKQWDQAAVKVAEKMEKVAGKLPLPPRTPEPPVITKKPGIKKRDPGPYR